MKKDIFIKAVILVVAFSLAQKMWADGEEVKCLAIVYGEGNEVDYFALDANPTITYSGDTMTVTQDGEDAYSIEDISIDEISSYHFENAVPSTEHVSGIGIIEIGHALMTGLMEGAQVHIYTINGQAVGTYTADSEGNVNVNLNSLKGGQVYILRTPKASYKIVK